MIDFSEMEPPADDKVYINQQGLVVMNISTLAKLQDPSTLRRLQKSLEKAGYKMFIPVKNKN